MIRRLCCQLFASVTLYYCGFDPENRLAQKFCEGLIRFGMGEFSYFERSKIKEIAKDWFFELGINFLDFQEVAFICCLFSLFF